MTYTAPKTIEDQADAIIALASTAANEDMSGRGDGTVETAMSILNEVLANQNEGVPPTNVGAILELAEYFKNGGGGGAQKHRLSVEEGSQGNIGFYVRDDIGQFTVPVTELEGGAPFIIKEEDGNALTEENLSIYGDTAIPVKYNFDDLRNQVYAIMPNYDLSVYVYNE